jgi:hypothetical protein
MLDVSEVQHIDKNKAEAEKRLAEGIVHVFHISICPIADASISL